VTANGAHRRTEPVTVERRCSERGKTPKKMQRVERRDGHTRFAGATTRRSGT
jgi:hypothetical protein